MYTKMIASLILFGSAITTTDKQITFSAQDKQKYGFPSEETPWIYINFDDGMKPTLYPDSIARVNSLWGIPGKTVYATFRTLYEKSNPSVVPISEAVKIPKIIHQVWIGGPVPEAFKIFMQTWVDMHVGRGWQYKLWTDEDVKDYPLYNRKFYDATDNPGVKSDILKWEIVYNHGGVYVDVDHECLRPLDILHYTYDFYTCLQPLDSQLLQLGAALFAATPKHPILKHCIETVKDDWHKKGAPTKTGPLHFTKSFLLTAPQSDGIVAALPAYYMYPLSCTDKDMNHKKWISNGAFAIHWWAKSWMPKKYRAPYFRNLNNDKAAESWND